MSRSLSLADILERNSEHIELRMSDNRIICKLSGHEMAPRAEVVSAYLNGKKFRKLREWYSFDFTCFQPWIVDHKQSNKKLFCKLTKQTLNKIPDKIQQHMNGKKFIRFTINYPVLLF